MSMNNLWIVDVYPLKAQFLRGEPVTVAIELANPGVTPEQLALKVRVFNLLTLEDELTIPFFLGPHEAKTIEAQINPKEVEFRGYGVDIHLYRGEQLLQVFSSAFDVVSGWRKATRYGFLCDFGAAERNDRADIQSMCKLHLNLVQFYDWMYRHDDLLPPESEFADLMGRRLSLDTVRAKIESCHRYGMKAVAYGAVYAASHDFYRGHPDWALYDSAGQPYNLAELFYIMNIAPESPWCQHIIAEYCKAVELVGFDGIHMDTYGFPKTAFSRRQGQVKVERLAGQFPALIAQTRQELQKIKPDVALIFNAVGNWPVETVAPADQDVVYIEVWQPYERYHHIQQLILQAKTFGKGKPVILAAYLKPFSGEGKNERPEAETAARILTAVIAANGGYHLIMGEKEGILTEGYYVRYAALDDVFYRVIRNSYDFIVRYANLLFDNELQDVSMTHLGGDNLEYEPLGFSYSAYGEPGKVWLVVREKPGYKTISLINLTGNEEDYWNRGKKEPPPVTNLEIRIQLTEGVKNVFLASPDEEMGRPARLDFRIEPGKRGKVLIVDIPTLLVWSLLVVEME